jgi:hypothetical protein
VDWVLLLVFFLSQKLLSCRCPYRVLFRRKTETVIRIVFLLQALVFCLSCAGAQVQTSEVPADAAPPSDTLGLLAIPNSRRIEGFSQDARPVENTFHVNVGHQRFQLKTHYQENREETDELNGISHNSNLRRHFSILATSSFTGSSLIGEGEVGYSPVHSVDGECMCSESPMMLRWGLKNRWNGLSYGADYRSLGGGFVSVGGVRIDQPRDEGELWSEHSFGSLKVRGSIGESWETLSDINSLRVSKTATTLFDYNRPKWQGTVVSSYALVEQDGSLPLENKVLTTTLTGSYRPLSVLSLTPHVGIKEEWDQNAGIRTETPLTGFTIAYEPYRDRFKLTGGTSFSRSFSEDKGKDISTFGASALFDWKLGKLLAREQILSLNINYNRQLAFTLPNNPHSDFGGMLRLTIAGF